MRRMMMSSGAASGASIPVNTVAPTVTTTGKIGSGVTGAAGTWTGATSYTYQHQWYNDLEEAWEDIPGETALNITAISSAYDSKQARLAVTGISFAGSTTAYSDPYDVTYVAPTISAVGTITGGTAIGNTLTHSGLTLGGGGGAIVLRDWQGDGVTIPGTANSPSINTSGMALDGVDVTVDVTVTNSGGSDNDETPAITMAYAVPVGTDSAPVSWTEDVAITPIDLWTLFAVAGDPTFASVTFSITGGNTNAGASISGNRFLQATPTAAQAQTNLVITATNSGGADTANIPVTITAASFATVADTDAAIWWDIQDLDTLWADTARTTPASLNGAVQYVDDKIGTRDLTFVTGSAILRQGANSRYYLEIATNTHFTVVNGIGFINDKPALAIFSAWNNSDIVGEACGIQFMRSTINSSIVDVRFVNGVPAANVRRDFVQGTANTVSWGSVVNTACTVTVIADYAVANVVTLRVNGAAATPVAITGTGNADDQDGLGGQAFNNTILTQDLVGAFYGAALFDTLPSASEIDFVEDHLESMFSVLVPLAAPQTGDWSLANAAAVTGDRLTATVTVPAGMGVDGVEYGTGAVGSWLDSGLSSSGSFQITCPTWETSTTIRLRWKRGVNRSAEATKTATPQFASTVRFVATTGSDAAAGTYAAPWRWPSKAGTTLTAGQTCYIRPGTYGTSSGRIIASNSGTSGNPITVKALPGERHLAILDGNGISTRGMVEIRAKDWWVIEGLRIYRAPTDGIYIEGASGQVHGNHVIRANQIDTTGNAGIFGCGLVMGQTPDVGEYRTDGLIIEYNNITNTNTPTAGNECISIGGGVRNCITRYNYIHDSRQYGIDYKLGVSGGAIYGNYIVNMLKHGIYIDCACRTTENIDVYDNWIERAGQNLGNGMVTAREADRGDDAAPGGGTYGYFQNLINIRLWNNICIDSGNFGMLLSKHSFDTNVGQYEAEWTHNTFYNAGVVETAGFEGKIDNLVGVVDIQVANNIFYGPSGTTFSNTYTGAGDTVTNNVTTNPSFTSTASKDFTLQSGSAAQGAGSATYRKALDYGGYMPSLGAWNYELTPLRTPVTRAATPDCGALERLAA
jgi:hypothetical protein